MKSPIDTIYEQVEAEQTVKLPSFKRVALLVSRAMAGLAAQRQAKSIPGQVEVFTKEEDAFAHLDAL